MEKTIISLLLLFSVTVSAQDQSSFSFSPATLEELKMTFYEKDSTAIAVVLNEQGRTYHDKYNNYDLTTDYYVKIKILKKEGYKWATIKLHDNGANKISKIRGVTYNLSESGVKSSSLLKKENIFKSELVKGGTEEIKFTLPDVKVGSVIEYKYSTTRWSMQLNDWYFQTYIPKVKSTYSTSTLSDWNYDIRLQGFLELDKSVPSIDDRCIYRKGQTTRKCKTQFFEMKNIPAFKSEKYISSDRNFISRLVFDLASRLTYGYKLGKRVRFEEIFSKTWEGVDELLRIYFFDYQSGKSKFFKKKLPKEIFNEKNELAKARLVFEFIQDHFTWNNWYFTNAKMNLKKTFEEKVGNATEINLSLYNSLSAANIESYPVALSTRSNGVLDDTYPSNDDFNYTIVKAVINGKDYFLDATDKYLAFGQVSFRSLNGKVRVLDFEKGSYWDNISIKNISSINTRLNLVLNNENEFEGDMVITSKGYKALDKRVELDKKNEEQYLENIESKNPYLEINRFEVVNKDNLNESLEEKFEVTFYNDTENQQYQKINPFFDERITENPFKFEERKYPIDFGVPSNYSYLFTLEIPEGYSIVSIPEESRVTLPNKGGVFMMKAQKKENEVNIYMRYALSKAVYTSEEYNDLKEFFNQIIKAQKSYIEINPN